MFTFFNSDILSQKKIKYGKLLSVSYSNSGDMNGNLDIVRVNVDDLKIVTRYSQYHNEPIKVCVYSIKKEDVDELIRIINKYKLLSFSKLPMGDLFAYDAPTKTLSFTYDNSKLGGSIYDNYGINYYMKLSKKQKEQLGEFTSYMFSLVREDNLVNSYVEENR